MRDSQAGTVFTDLPPEEKTVYRLAADGFSLTGAGTEVTANMLTCATYFVLAHPDQRARLERGLPRNGIDPAGKELTWGPARADPVLVRRRARDAPDVPRHRHAPGAHRAHRGPRLS
ncbi:cytochrome P450 [Apiospora aurea]|uniref:Cytochrome P450 n=1 Tax=Apiospora aurea TaxID=335848 RepID=A0ABR1QZP5_9PEZI